MVYGWELWQSQEAPPQWQGKQRVGLCLKMYILWSTGHSICFFLIGLILVNWGMFETVLWQIAMQFLINQFVSLYPRIWSWELMKNECRFYPWYSSSEAMFFMTQNWHLRWHYCSVLAGKRWNCLGNCYIVDPCNFCPISFIRWQEQALIFSKWLMALSYCPIIFD